MEKSLKLYWESNALNGMRKKIHNFQVVNENEMTLKHVNVDRNIGCDNNRKKYEDDETKLIRKVEQY